MPGDHLAPKEKRVRVRELKDYDAATVPSFPVDYHDLENNARSDKLRKNPLVPIGALGTAAILAGGLFQFKKGNAVWSQRFMRARVLAQGATLGILAFSVYEYNGDKNTAGADVADAHDAQQAAPPEILQKSVVEAPDSTTAS
jgi:hypothetical protein